MKKKSFEPEPVLDFLEPPSHVEDGDAARTTLPVRTCIVERTRKEKPFLLRFVLTPANEVLPDLKSVLPGRGVWVTAGKQQVAEAVKRRAFERAFRRVVSASPELPQQVEELLKRSALERLSICKKAGLVVTGSAKLEEAIKRGEIISLMHAKDGAAGGKTKLDSKFAALYSGADRIAPRDCFTSVEISLATGNTNVIHAGLKEGGASRTLLQALDRYSSYCGGDVSSTPSARVKNERNERNG